jgi:repressor LexA
MLQPTPRQLEALAIIKTFTEAAGYPPTLRDLCTRMGMKSTNAADTHLVALEKKGLLVREPRLSRSMVITPAGLEALAKQRDAVAEAGRDYVSTDLAKAEP